MLSVGRGGGGGGVEEASQKTSCACVLYCTKDSNIVPATFILLLPATLRTGH